MNTATANAEAALSNPLLDLSGLPRFDAVLPEHVSPAIDAMLAHNRAVLAGLEAPLPEVTWDNFIQPMHDASDDLSRVWGVVNHLNGVLDSPPLRAAYNENQPKLTEFWTQRGQNQALFDKFKALRDSPAFGAMSAARRKLVLDEIRSFRLSGAELGPEQKLRYAELQDRQSVLSTRFSENVLDATNDYAIWVSDEAELAGLPADVKASARAAAAGDAKPGFKFTMHFPSYFPLLQFADRRHLREAAFRANTTKASELGTVYSKCAEWDNSMIMVELLRLRDEEAKLLGFADFAELSLETKMADSPRQVTGFLEDLARRARPFAEKDLAELQAFARAELGLDRLEPWDITYASEKLRERMYSYSAQEVKLYFPAPKVIEGLFRLAQNLFSVRIVPDTAPVWHPDVQFFRVERDGVLLSQFYFDLYARPGKSGGAWMGEARERRRLADGRLQTPVTWMVCNFTPPLVEDGVAKPALLTHAETTTLFHEFGHGLHLLLTQVDELGVSGLSGVEWDAVELPSQFMENFCWEWEVLRHMSAHAETGAALPRALFDKMVAARNFQAGLLLLRQVEMGLCDMRLHQGRPVETREDVQQTIDQVRREVAVIQAAPFNRFQHSFSHIFGGGYSAGYYSYKWAEVLSADAYGAFEEAAEAGQPLSVPGARFQAEILAVGGSRTALESFKAFRGREPDIGPLLRHHGMAPPQPTA